MGGPRKSSRSIEQMLEIDLASIIGYNVARDARAIASAAVQQALRVANVRLIDLRNSDPREVHAEQKRVKRGALGIPLCAA